MRRADRPVQGLLPFDEPRMPAEARSAPPNPVAALAAKHRLKAVCLFSSAGIGELGIERCGIDVICASELIPYRVSLYRENFPSRSIVEGDIWESKEEIATLANASLGSDELFLLYATPPCQGMSTNGMGRLKWEISEGRRGQEDPRNRLIIPTVQLIQNLRPRWVLLENVPGMRNTVIRDDQEGTINIIDYIRRGLGPDYVGRAEVIACEDYGIPQRRTRLVTIFTRDRLGKAAFFDNGGSFFSRSMREPRKTLRDAIAHVPALDARHGKNRRPDFHRYHYVNVINDQKYWWIENTPEGDTAFNNQCANPRCGFQGNARHNDELSEGKWTSGKRTPIHCMKCGELLPRPVVQEDDGSLRLLKGFHSAYRRMKWDEPARTLTQNFIYEASDNKIHPAQNRVLSVLEALVLQTIDRYEYRFEIGGKDIGAAKIAEVIGESVPPYLIEKVCTMMISASLGAQTASQNSVQTDRQDRSEFADG